MNVGDPVAMNVSAHDQRAARRVSCDHADDAIARIGITTPRVDRPIVLRPSLVSVGRETRLLADDVPRGAGALGEAFIKPTLLRLAEHRARLGDCASTQPAALSLRAGAHSGASGIAARPTGASGERAEIITAVNAKPRVTPKALQGADHRARAQRHMLVEGAIAGNAQRLEIGIAYVGQSPV